MFLAFIEKEKSHHLPPAAFPDAQALSSRHAGCDHPAAKACGLQLPVASPCWSDISALGFPRCEPGGSQYS